MRYYLTLLFIGIGMVTTVAQVTVRAALDNSNVLIGDQVNLHLEASYPSGHSVTSVNLTVLDSIVGQQDQAAANVEPSALELLRQTDWETITNGNITTYRKDLTLTGWQEGVYFIPPVAFTIETGSGTLNRSTNQLTLLVASPIQESEASDTIQIAPIKEIELEEWRFSDFLPIFYILGGIGLLILAIASLITYLRRRKQAPVVAPIVIRPAHEVALEKLQQLKAAELWQKGEIKTYQSQLTYIIREYIENRYQILALESTTGEILRDLKSVDFPEALVPDMREMLQLADMVKFAKAQPPEAMHDRLMSYAEEIVRTTKREQIISDPKEEDKDN